MATALVTGATGILGRAIVHELAANQQEWRAIYAVSRSKVEAFPAQVRHQHLDLTGSPKDMAKELTGVFPDYIFFSAYLQRGDDEQLYKDNVPMLSNFLEALEISGASKHVKRVILVTGAKQYGVHLGRVKCPMEESDPWLTDKAYPPNFYYGQQDVLQKKATAQGWTWTVTYPNDVIGLAKGNFMNLSTALGLYATISREMGTTELTFPGAAYLYTTFDNMTSAKLHARFCAWAAKAPGARNEAFNVVDGDPVSWQRMWPIFCDYFGLKVPARQFENTTDESSSTELPSRPPIADSAASAGMEGSDLIKQSKVSQTVNLQKWSQRDDVKNAWKTLAQRENLDAEAFDKATWGFLDFVLGREYDLVISMKKARQAGWTEYQDSWEALKETLGELKAEKILP